MTIFLQGITGPQGDHGTHVSNIINQSFCLLFVVATDSLLTFVYVYEIFGIKIQLENIKEELKN